MYEIRCASPTGASSQPCQAKPSRRSPRLNLPGASFREGRQLSGDSGNGSLIVAHYGRQSAPQLLVRQPGRSETARSGCPYRGPCGPVGLPQVVELTCRYPPIEKKIGLRYGTSQITHTATLNLWKLVIQRSSLLTKTTVAQIACTNIRMMASRPVRP